MVIKRRIETNRAKALRNQRQHFAAPGGRHDRLIAFLSRALPMGVGVMAAFMVVTPLSPRGEVSFLLDRAEVDVIDNRLSVDNAMYRGRDDEGRPFSITAGEAVQRSSTEGLVRMEELVAQMLMDDGPARLSAPGGTYDIRDEVVNIDGLLEFHTADGFDLTASGVSFDLDTRVMSGDNGVTGTVPAGSFSADRFRADVDARRVRLDGNAKLRMVPGELRMPNR